MTVSHSVRGSVPAPSETRVPEWTVMGKPLRAACRRPKSFQTILCSARPGPRPFGAGYRRPKSFQTILSCEPLRRFPVPVGLELEPVRDIENARLSEMRTHDLQADRQSADEAAGNRQGGQSCQIRADGVDVVQIHGDGIGGLGADAKGGRGARGTDEHVDLAEGAPEVGGDELPHALRLQVVRVVVSRRQHVRARHDAALDLGPEALAARAAIEILQVARLVAAVAEADPV